MSLSNQLDVAIIGAGTSGLSALRQVRRQTENFALINAGHYGTTCARVGCMPSKALIEAANAFHHGRGLGRYGVTGSDGLSVEIAPLLRHVRDQRDHYVSGVLKSTADLGERSIAGHARFVSPDTLDVDGRRLRARRIIIATGSRPIVPAQWERLGDAILTSDNLFEQSTLPARMAVVGFGSVGAEMAQALSRLGIEVTAFGSTDQIAGITDPEVNARAIALMRAEFTLHLGTPAELAADGARVRVRAGGESVLTEKVLVSLGRKPNLDGLGLEALGAATDSNGVPLFNRETMQVGDLPVFIAGDVDADAALLHEAADEGYIAGFNATRDKPHCFKRRAPLAITFTDPNIARVGRPFESLRVIPHVTGRVDLKGQGRLRMSGTDRGCLSLYAAPDTGLLLGAEICAPHGEHLAHLLALAVQHQLTALDLLRMPFYHPVVEEGLRKALRALAAQLPGERVSDLAHCDRPEADALD